MTQMMKSGYFLYLMLNISTQSYEFITNQRIHKYQLLVSLLFYVLLHLKLT